MSGSTPDPDTTNKPKRRTVKHLEKCQGFDFKNGLASIPRNLQDKAGPIGDLYKSFKTFKGISSPQLETKARLLFDRLGPHLWPRDTSRAWWLLKPRQSDCYPRRLYYDDEEDREQYVSSGLRSSLLSLMMNTDFGVTSSIWSMRSALITKML
jgi:hypothetical protein